MTLECYGVLTKNMHSEATGVIVQGAGLGLDCHSCGPHREFPLTPHPLWNHLHIIIGHKVRQGDLSQGLVLVDLNKYILWALKLFKGYCIKQVQSCDLNTYFYCTFHYNY